MPDEIINIDPSLIESFFNELPEKAMRFSIQILMTIMFFIIGVWIIKIIRKIVKKSLTKAKADKGVIQFLDAFLKAALYVLLIFMLASGFGLEATGVVAVLGSAGVAIGLALQGSLSNLAGGVLILLLKPFKVGDFITESTYNQSGTVDEIGLFYTKIQMPDNKIIVMPNGMLANNGIVNATAMNKRRIDILVGITYDANIKEAKDVLYKLLENDESVLKHEEKVVFVDELASSSVNLNLRCWVKNDDYWNVKWKLTEEVKEALEQAKIDIPYPQMDIWVKEKS